MCEGLVMANGLACFSGRAISEPIGSGIGRYWDVFNIMPRQSLGPLKGFHKCHQYGIMKRTFRPSGSGPFGVRALSSHVWVFQTFIIEVEAAIDTSTLWIQILFFLGLW